MNSPSDDATLDELARRLGDRLQRRGLRLATAESCTGGWIAKIITDVPGSSRWFDLGIVSYSNQAKEAWLGVPEEIISLSGAVSEQTVMAMVRGLLARSGVDLALAVSGIAGPGGGSVAKPVGTVCFAWGGDGLPVTARYYFAGDREAVRRQAVGTALLGAMDYLEREP